MRASKKANEVTMCHDLDCRDHIDDHYGMCNESKRSNVRVFNSTLCNYNDVSLIYSSLKCFDRLNTVYPSKQFTTYRYPLYANANP